MLLPRSALRLALALAASLLLAACTTRPTEYREPAPLAQAARTARNLAVFDRTWELVDARYFDPQFRGVDWPAQRARFRPEAARAKDDDELYLVLNRLLATLGESHLVALPPRLAHEQRTEHRAALGLRLRLIDGRRVVTDTVPGGPAESAGVRPGWIFVRRDGRSLDSETRPDPLRVGQSVVCEFLDEHDQPQTRTLDAALLNFDRRLARRLDDGTLWLRLDDFSLGSVRWLGAQLKLHRDAPALVVDLRTNPGGLAFAVRTALGHFFPAEVDTGRSVRRNGRARPWESRGFAPARFPGRVAVLIDRDSASAAEICARVLQHHRRATVVGRPSRGAVILSRYFKLPDGGRLSVPIEDYLDPTGQRLEGRGVTPDLATPLPTLAEIRAGHDPDLLAALRALGPPP